MNYLYIEPGDSYIEKRLVFTQAELKVIFNHFLDVVEDYPEMLTFEAVLHKIKERVEETENLDYFYGVNEIYNVEPIESTRNDGYEIAVDMDVQSTLTHQSENIVVFFSPEQLEDIGKITKKFKNILK